MKEVLLVGEYYSTNLGDNILCQCTEQYIIDKFSDQYKCSWLDLTYGSRVNVWKKLMLYFPFILRCLGLNVLADKIAVIIRKYWVTCTLKKKLRRKRYNLILFAGGQMFMDYFAESILSVVSIANKYNIPVVFNACGTGRNTPRTIQQFKLALSYPNVKNISTRDDALFFYEIGMKNISIIPDIAILSAEILDIRKQKSEIIGLGVLSPGIYNQNNESNVSEDEFYSFWRNIINFLESKKQKWQFFTNGSKEDYEFACRVLDNLNLPNKGDFLAVRPISGDELMRIIAEYKSILSFRLHSHIIAYSLSIPSFGVVWDKKLVEFAKMIQKECCFFCMADLNEKFLDALISIDAETVDDSFLRIDLGNEIEKSFVEYLNVAR